MGKIILVTSGKGGTGKSTFTVNCGTALALLGQKVLLIDTDAGLRALDMMLSVSDEVVYDLADVLDNRCKASMAILQTHCTNLSLLPAPSTNEEPFSVKAFQRLCQGLSRYFDIILLDSPAGCGAWAQSAAQAADQALVIATADPVSIRDADVIAGKILSNHLSNIRLIINRVQPRILQKKLHGGLDTVIDAAAVQLIGIIPEDDRITLAAFDGHPIVRSTAARNGAARAFCNIARRLLGENVPLYKM